MAPLETVNRDDLAALHALSGELRDVERWNTFAASGGLSPSLSLQFNRTRRGIGRFASRKVALQMPYVSSLERDLLYLLEVDPGIRAFLTQPLTLRYRDGEFIRTHLPDVLCLARDQVALCEVKYADEAALPEVQRRTQSLKEGLAPHGISYRVLTEKVIRAEPRLTNARVLCRYRWLTPDQHVLDPLQEYLERHGSLTIRDAAAKYERTAEAATSILAAVLRGQLSVQKWVDPMEDSILLGA